MQKVSNDDCDIACMDEWEKPCGGSHDQSLERVPEKVVRKLKQKNESIKTESYCRIIDIYGIVNFIIQNNNNPQAIFNYALLVEPGKCNNEIYIISLFS